jgi:hypothetical protein
MHAAECDECYMVMEDVRSIIHAICCHDVVNYSHEKLFNIIQLNLHK